MGAIALTAAIALAYFIAARLSLELLTKPEGVAVFWPASGVSAGALIALGPRARWPVVFGTLAATIVANLLGDRSFWGAVLFGLCNAGEAALTAWLVGRCHGPGFTLSKPLNVIILVGAATIGTAVSGIGGAIVFRLFQGATTPIWVTWQHWFASDGLGIIVVAPLLIEFASAARDRPPMAELLEGALTVAILALVSVLAIFLHSDLLAPWGQSPSCSRRSCGSRRDAGRSLPQPRLSSSVFRSFGQRLSASDTSAIPRFRSRNAYLQRRSVFCL